jgi:hypothetical protein
LGRPDADKDELPDDIADVSSGRVHYNMNASGKATVRQHRWAIYFSAIRIFDV